MARLAEEESNIITIKGGFQYSNIGIEKLMATSYTLGTLVVDCTGSLQGREADLEGIMQKIVEKLQNEDTAQSILWRVVIFNSYIGVKEIHGFKLLQDINPASDYDGIECEDMTPLYDAVGSSIEATLVEAARLWDEEYGVNAISVFITDGDDNRSTLTSSDIKEKTDMAIKGEKIESFRTILVGVTTITNTLWADHVSKKLSEFHVEAGLTEYIDLEDFNEDAIKKIILQVSSLTSDTSKQLGSGGPSQLVF